MPSWEELMAVNCE